MGGVATGNLGQVVWLLFGLVYVVLAVMAALAIHKDATAREKLTLDLHPAFWALSSFVLTPMVAVGVYWLLHYSSIADD